MRYITTPIWVTNDLGLSGNEALMYSLIYNATHNGKEFYGSIDYMVKALHISRKTVINVRDKLIKKDLIKKRVEYISQDQSKCYYRINKEKLNGIDTSKSIPLPNKNKTSTEIYQDYQQNEYDFDELERELLAVNRGV
jgi:hypothetical protein